MMQNNNDETVFKVAGHQDWQSYKAIRTHALESVDSGIFKKDDGEDTMTDADWENYLKNPDNLVFLAYSNNEVVGLSRAKRLAGDGNWYGGGFYIKKEYRRLGVGYFLNLFAMKLLVKEKGAVKITGMVETWNEPQLKLMKSLGAELGAIKKFEEREVQEAVLTVTAELRNFFSV
jgi:ribosomal protein S18 acetylase RimI-like enzyme